MGMAKKDKNSLNFNIIKPIPDIYIKLNKILKKFKEKLIFNLNFFPPSLFLFLISYKNPNLNFKPNSIFNLENIIIFI